MKKILITSSFILLIFTLTASAATFNSDLKVGSTGEIVSTLQMWLIQNGFHIPSIENGKAQKGRFGMETKAAVVKYQRSVGVPATGFVGPLTRGKLNGTVPPTNSQTPTQSSNGLPPGITTLGVPGIMAVSQGPLSNTTVHAGDTNVPVITVRVQAQNSDLAFNGLVIDLGTNANAYNKIFKKIYFTSRQLVLTST